MKDHNHITIQVKELIASNQTERAIELLLKYLTDKNKRRRLNAYRLHDRGLLLSGQFRGIRDRRNAGLSNNDEYTSAINNINARILHLVNDLERHQFISQNVSNHTPPELADHSVEGKVDEILKKFEEDSTYLYDVFLSFSNQDLDYARTVWKQLLLSDLRVFFYPEDLRPGDEWMTKIDVALKKSKSFVLVCTPFSMKSAWVKVEWHTFFNEYFLKNRNERKFVIVQGPGYRSQLLPAILKSSVQNCRNLDRVTDVLSVGEESRVEIITSAVTQPGISEDAVLELSPETSIENVLPGTESGQKPEEKNTAKIISEAKGTSEENSGIVKSKILANNKRYYHLGFFMFFGLVLSIGVVRMYLAVREYSDVLESEDVETIREFQSGGSFFSGHSSLERKVSEIEYGYLSELRKAPTTDLLTAYVNYFPNGKFLKEFSRIGSNLLANSADSINYESWFRSFKFQDEMLHVVTQNGRYIRYSCAEGMSKPKPLNEIKVSGKALLTLDLADNLLICGGLSRNFYSIDLGNGRKQPKLLVDADLNKVIVSQHDIVTVKLAGKDLTSFDLSGTVSSGVITQDEGKIKIKLLEPHESKFMNTSFLSEQDELIILRKYGRSPFLQTYGIYNAGAGMKTFKMDFPIVSGAAMQGDTILLADKDVHVVKGNIELFSLKGHEGIIRSMDYSYPDQVVFSGSDDGSVILWKINGDQGEFIKKIVIGSPVLKVNYDEASGNLFVSSKAGGMRIYDLSLLLRLWRK